MILAVEDILGEVVARKILKSIRPDIVITNIMGHKGKTYLKKKARDLNLSASGNIIFLLVDLDDLAECPINLISSWLGGAPHSNLIFRLAVSEIEAWILGDRSSFSSFLGIPSNRIPINTDSIPQAKEFVVSLARRSRSRRIKTDLVPRMGGTARVGPGYNPCITDFVLNHWDPKRAEVSSESLRRAIKHIKGI